MYKTIYNNCKTIATTTGYSVATKNHSTEKYMTPLIFCCLVLSDLRILVILVTISSLEIPNFFDLNILTRSLEDIGFLSRYLFTDSSVNPSL